MRNHRLGRLTTAGVAPAMGLKRMALQLRAPGSTNASIGYMIPFYLATARSMQPIEVVDRIVPRLNKIEWLS